LEPAGGADAADRLREALRHNERAEQLEGDNVPGTVWSQRAELYSRLGDATSAAQFTRRAQEVAVESAQHKYQIGRDELARGQHRAALPHLEKAAELEPTLFWAHFAQGLCHDGLGQYSQARACYTTAVALWPEFPWGYYNRGLTSLRLGDYARAKADLDRVAELEPRFAETYVNRAIACQGLRRHADGIADLDKAGELGADAARVCLMRSRLREAAGDKAGAKQDLDQGLRQVPADEHGWVARGLARMRTDAPSAVTDFEAALKLNPRSLTALQNLAHVLGRLGRNEEAVVVLDRAVELYPDFVPSRAGRGVIHARLGHWAAAEADALEALKRDVGPANQYQTAGIYAVLSRNDPKHKSEALRLLTASLRAGYGFEHIETDRELDPIRGDAEFRKVLDGARSLVPRRAG
jgi:tetratricopeptide (TPR) repeat protein